MRRRHVIEAMLSQLGSSRTSAAVDDAQEIMFEAWDCGDPKRRVALARQALSVSPHCADAYVLLAEETADTAKDAAALLAQGVAAGEKALGKAAFVEDVGLFWGLIETRPYMRARLSLALAQWEVGEAEEAVAHAWELLRLNPNDNQGVRYILIDWLLLLGRDAEIAALIKRYRQDGGTQWLWSLALATFRTKGDRAASRAALARAQTANGHVAAFLSGRKKLPRRRSDFVRLGGSDEAAEYARDSARTWSATPGALAWLAEQIGAPPPTRPRAARKPS